MSITQEACPRCRGKGNDTRGDNLIVYRDGGSHCFACGFHRNPPFYLTFDREPVQYDEQKVVLPSDLTGEIPAELWRWVLRYGLSLSYWRPSLRYSPSEERLIFLHGEPVEVACGRAFGSGVQSKWKIYGGKSHRPVLINPELSGEIVLTEDLISAHVVGQVRTTLPLFGTHVSNNYLKELDALKRPVCVWLDSDQYGYLPAKLNRLETFLEAPVRYIYTEQDPKMYSINEINQILGEK